MVGQLPSLTGDHYYRVITSLTCTCLAGSTSALHCIKKLRALRRAAIDSTPSAPHGPLPALHIQASARSLAISPASGLGVESHSAGAKAGELQVLSGCWTPSRHHPPPGSAPGQRSTWASVLARGRYGGLTTSRNAFCASRCPRLPASRNRRRLSSLLAGADHPRPAT